MVAIPIPDTSDYLIALRCLSPAFNHDVVFGLLPAQVNHRGLFESLQTLFARNGPPPWSIVEGIPSYVRVPGPLAAGDSMSLSAEEVRTLFLAAMKGFIEDDLLSFETQMLLNVPDARERVGTGEEIERRSETVARNARVMRRFAEFDPLELEARFKGASMEEWNTFYRELAEEEGMDTELNERPASPTRPLREGTFLDWFEAVADPDHVEREKNLVDRAMKRQLAVLLRPQGIVVPEYEYRDD